MLNLEEGSIFDLRIGVEIAPTGQMGKKETPLGKNKLDILFGEFDCVFTDGKRLFIVECKAGSVTQEHIQKLENNLKLYGGIAARGILFHAFPLAPKAQQRIMSSTSIRSLPSSNLNTNVLRNLIMVN